MGKTRKVLNLIALVVFLGSNFLTPLSYAFADEESVQFQQASLGTEIDKDEASLIKGGAEQSEAEGLTGDKNPPVANATSPLTEGGQEASQSDKNEASLIRGGAEQSEAEGLTGSEEILSPSDSSFKKEQNEGDTETSPLPSPNLGEGSPDEIGTGEVEVEPLTGTALELATARETLEGPITESETFDELGMVVKVKALSGTFPKGTRPEITLIQGTEKEKVEQQIIDDPDTDVSADAEMITFDIKFIYTLSNGSGVEVQPKDNTVQVTFEYKGNEELQQAEDDIQIIHINDKDEDGKTVAEGEEKVETIDINEQKSAKVENGLVIDAESFSYYTIVVQRAEETPEGQPTQTWKYGKDYFIISIAKPDSITEPDLPAGIIIMDRNLGATTTGYGGVSTASTDSYGNYYQWGNNYGFNYSLGNNVTIVNDCLPWDSNYIHSGYVSKNWINGGKCNYDVWGTSSTDHYDGIWGGENDADANRRGAKLTNYTDRQGPCPSGWHVPSAGEWGLLIRYWAQTQDNGTSNNANWGGSKGLFNLTDHYADFQQKFNLPFASYRSNDGSYGPQGSLGYYWSSSPYGLDYPNNARHLNMANLDRLTAGYSDLRSEGNSVRCFKDSYVAPKTYTLTFDSQGGTEVATGTTPENDTRSRPENPTKTDYTFVDWFLSGTNTLFDFTTPATGNLIVYAKWCGAGQTYYQELGACATRDADNIVYYWNDGSNDVISIVSGDTILTMMDKNLGATSNDINSTGSYGYHYQWGNNYGFEQGCNGNGSSCYDDITTNHSVSGQTGYENFWPGHPYSNPTFLMGNSDYWSSNLHYDNLWGGSGDSTSNNRGGINNGDTRQGPCPDGYHVPSMREWETVLQYFAGKVG